MANSELSVATKKVDISNDYINFPAIEFEQHSRKIYIFHANAKSLWELLKVNERVDDKEEGYQRALSNSRATDVARFIQNKGILTPSIIISLDGAKFDSKKNEIQLKNVPNSGWVIDGQHRLRGAYLAAIDKDNPIDIQLPVVAFIDLDESEQIIQFVTINKEGKGVPTSLYLDLIKQLPTKKTTAEIAKEKVVEIARAMKKDTDSIFYEKIIFVRSPKKGELSVNNFVRKVSPLLTENKGILADFTQNEVIKILENYFVSLKTVFPEEFSYKSLRFFNTLGFGGVINAFEAVFQLTRTEFGTFTVEDIVKVLKRAEDYKFSNWQQYGTGSAAEIAVGKDLSTVIQSRAREAGTTNKLRLN